MIRITSKREGFRRCGIAHSRTAVDWPDDRFSPAEFAVLKAEPMLLVAQIPDLKDPDENETGDDITAMTVAQITEEISKYQPGTILKGLKKAELVEILKAHREAGHND